MDMLAKLSKLLEAVDEQSDDSSQVIILTFQGYSFISVSELKADVAHFLIAIPTVQ